MLGVRIITKEYGKMSFTPKEWNTFDITSVCLHSEDEPSYIEEHETYNKYLWLCDYQFHRLYQPSYYCITVFDGLDLNNKDIHNFYFKNGLLYHSSGKPIDETQMFNFKFHLNNKEYNLNNKSEFDQFFHISKNLERVSKIKKLYPTW